ncbi:MAG TPA: response regulator [Stellaceae bacterium]|nr:response regulator [Stellaceae bacterium]
MQNTNLAPIVVIEDHPEYLDYLATLLRRAGYAVAPFTAASAAVQFLQHHSASLVITDVFMPEMDGFEVLSQVRQRFPALPIIAVSGDGPVGGPMFLDAMRQLGACATLTKPIDAGALLAAIAQCLAQPSEGPVDEAI